MQLILCSARWLIYTPHASLSLSNCWFAREIKCFDMRSGKVSLTSSCGWWIRNYWIELQVNVVVCTATYIIVKLASFCNCPKQIRVMFNCICNSFCDCVLLVFVLYFCKWLCTSVNDCLVCAFLLDAFLSASCLLLLYFLSSVRYLDQTIRSGQEISWWCQCFAKCKWSLLFASFHWLFFLVKQH